MYKALLELIEEKGMEGVTVSELTERAGVNRGTFYLHFRDPSEMLNQYEMEVLDGLARELDRIDPFELQRYARKNEPYPVSLRVLLLAYWFETGRRLPPAEIARMVTRILSDGPLASIGLKE